MKHLKFLLLAGFFFYFYSCKNDKSKDNSSINENYVELSQDKSLSKSSPKEPCVNEIQNPKVLTFNEILDKQKQLNESIEDLSTYISDKEELEKRKELNNNIFYSYLTTQFKYMFSSELRILRNEFFARKGYIFKSEDLLKHFNKMCWYNPKYSLIDSIVLTNYEKQIIDSIAKYELLNKSFSEQYFKEELKLFFRAKEKKYYSYSSSVSVPSILFRRNIGYLVKGLEAHNKNWFNGEFLQIEIIDTTSEGNILLGLFGQANCPDQYCLYAGEIISCDPSLNYIDSHTVEFEDFSKTDTIEFEYTFEVRIPYESIQKIKVESDGKLTEL